MGDQNCRPENVDHRKAVYFRVPVPANKKLWLTSPPEIPANSNQTKQGAN